MTSLFFRETLGKHRKIALPPCDYSESAVLVPLHTSGEELSILFTRRTDRVTHHKGQISFPGGVREKGDRDLMETALRETGEEIGIMASQITVVGELDDLYTGTGYRITPYVGLLPPSYTIVTNNDEIDEVAEVPVTLLMEPRIHSIGTRSYKGKKFKSHFFEIRKDFVVWGATAHILAQFLEVVFGWKPPRGL